MNNIITAIAERIKAEHRKHPDIDWEYIAASKIYQSFIDTGNSTQEKNEPQLYGDEVENCNIAQHENISVLLNQRYIFTENIDVWGKKGMEVVFSKTHDEDSDNWYKVYYYGGLPFKIMKKKIRRWIKNGYLKLASKQYDFSEVDSVTNIEYNCDEAPVKKENASRDVITEDDVVKGLLRYHDKLYGDNTDTLCDTTNKNEDTVSNIIHNSDSEPSVNDKIIIDTEVYYTCLKDNKWFKKNNQIGFKEIPELPNMMEVNILNGNRFFLKSCAIKQMIANREIDTPF